MIAFLAGLAVVIGSSSAEQVRSGKDAFGDWRDDAPGVRRIFKVEDMPKPAPSESVANFPDKAAKKPDARPRLPEGFEAEAFATGLESPRVIRFAPNGDMFVADSKADQVRVYRLDENGGTPEYKGDAFVTLHGSWNRGKRTGYKVVRLLFKDGKPTGAYEDFATGFVDSDAGAWGRPVGVAVAPDGALFVSDDGSGTIWRISHKKR